MMMNPTSAISNPQTLNAHKENGSGTAAKNKNSTFVNCSRSLKNEANIIGKVQSILDQYKEGKEISESTWTELTKLEIKANFAKKSISDKAFDFTKYLAGCVYNIPANAIKVMITKTASISMNMLALIHKTPENPAFTQEECRAELSTHCLVSSNFYTKEIVKSILDGINWNRIDCNSSSNISLNNHTDDSNDNNNNNNNNNNNISMDSHSSFVQVLT
jgi:hypothetical protein